MSFIYFRARSERPEDWVPEEANSRKEEKNVHDEYSEILQVGENENRNIVDIFSIHSVDSSGTSLTYFFYFF